MSTFLAQGDLSYNATNPVLPDSTTVSSGSQIVVGWVAQATAPQVTLASGSDKIVGAIVGSFPGATDVYLQEIGQFIIFRADPDRTAWVATTGNRAIPTTVTTTTYDHVISDRYIVCLPNTAAANQTINLLPVSELWEGYDLTIKHLGTDLTYTVTVDGDNTETIDDSTTYVLNQYDALKIIRYSTEWIIV